MKVIEPRFDILTPISLGGMVELLRIENAARVCYKSESGDFEKTKNFIKMLIDKGHEAMLEHSTLSIKFTCDRGVSHELVRHRLASFAQESTRYCNYSKDCFENEITVIKPLWCSDENSALYATWKKAMISAEENYFDILGCEGKAQDARAVLPNSLKTEIIVTANYREWRNIFKLRTDLAAHPEMRRLMIPLLHELQNMIPVVFDDIHP